MSDLNQPLPQMLKDYPYKPGQIKTVHITVQARHRQMSCCLMRHRVDIANKEAEL